MQMSLNGDLMNEIMKVLTVFSTVFLPLSFIVGLYDKSGFPNKAEKKNARELK